MTGASSKVLRMQKRNAEREAVKQERKDTVKEKPQGAQGRRHGHGEKEARL